MQYSTTDEARSIRMMVFLEGLITMVCGRHAVSGKVHAWTNSLTDVYGYVPVSQFVIHALGDAGEKIANEDEFDAYEALPYVQYVHAAMQAIGCKPIDMNVGPGNGPKLLMLGLRFRTGDFLALRGDSLNTAFELALGNFDLSWHAVQTIMENDLDDEMIESLYGIERKRISPVF